MEASLIVKAEQYAREKLLPLQRLSGRPAIEHAEQTARLVDESGGDPIAVAAAWLHDLLEDTGVTREEIAQEFGESVASVVASLTRPSTEQAQATGFCCAEAALVFAVAVGTLHDPRVGVIKVADRLANLRDPHPRIDRRQRLARQTLSIYVPLARSLSLLKWAGEMTTLACDHLRGGEPPA